MCIQKPGVGLV